jgi:XRE family transcriptional regulator, regulator of sulfur utilization
MIQETSMKGIARYLMDERLEGEPIHLHVSEVAPGERSHPPHRHGGYEAFYMLAGTATLELDEERVTLGAGDVAVFDPQRLHGLVNSGDVTMRYIVVLRP